MLCKNVFLHHILLCKMLQIYFGITFRFAKCLTTPQKNEVLVFLQSKNKELKLRY